MLPRNKLVLEFWDRSKELSVNNKEYRSFAYKFLLMLLKQDIGHGDTTSNSLIKNRNISAVIIAKEDGIFAGLEEFKLLNSDLKIKSSKNDGGKIKTGEILVQISGSARIILERERTSLNLLQRMSGIATLTNKLAKNLGNVKLAATRKTLWGSIDKRAVSTGRGLTHRLNLNDSIIIKDNHLKILDFDLEEAISYAKNKSKYIEIEVEDEKQALRAARIIKKIKSEDNKKLFAIMLDKIPPNKIKSIVQDLKSKNLYDTVLLEASGNINEKNIVEYKNCGIDIISMGQITNSAKVLNMSLEIR